MRFQSAHRCQARSYPFQGARRAHQQAAMKLILSGEPKSTQHIYQSQCRGGYPSVYMTTEGKVLKQQYQWEARSQWKGPPMKGDVEVSVTFYFGTKRRADLDNFNKLWADALSGIVYEDDSQIAVLHLHRAYDR